MRQGLVFFIFSVFLLVTATAAVAQNGQPSVISIRHSHEPQKSRLVIDLDRAVKFRVFTMADPARVVVDMPTARWKSSKTRLVNQGALKGYRSGELQEGLTRIVFDLAKPATVEKAFLLPQQGSQKDRLVIDLRLTNDHGFRARLADVFGTANLRDHVSPNAAPLSEMARQEGLALGKIAPPSQKPAVKSAGTSTVSDRTAGTVMAGALATATPAKKPQAGRRRGKYVVVLDPGHGGADPGAIGVGGIYEKNITLQIARELRRQLEATGRYRVVLTRDKDVNIRLRERVTLSRRVNADLFISIHADKIGRNNVRGASVYTLSSSASDAETARLAEQENNAGVVAGVDLSTESQDVAGILLDLAMREKMNESALLARYLVDALRRENVRLLPNSHRSAGFAVLKAPDVPAVLLESGFLSNASEAKLLSTAQFQAKIAKSVTGGIDAYFRKMEALQKN